MATNNPTPQRWKKRGSRVVAQTPVFEVTAVGYEHPHRSPGREFSVIRAPDWVNVVALTPTHELVMVRQFRFGTDDLSVEIPGGMIEPGEDPLHAGARELREETGFVGGPARLLGRVHPNPAIQSNTCHYVLVPDAQRRAALAWDENEEIEVWTQPVDEAYALARAGGITHALVLDALFFFAPVWEEIRRGRPV